MTPEERVAEITKSFERGKNAECFCSSCIDVQAHILDFEFLLSEHERLSKRIDGLEKELRNSKALIHTEVCQINPPCHTVCDRIDMVLSEGEEGEKV